MTIKKPPRIQTRAIQHLDNEDEGGGGFKSCFLPLLIVAIVAGAIGTYFYLNWDRYFGKPPEDNEPEYVPPPKPKLKPAEVAPPPPVEEEKPPAPPPKKTVAQLKAEADEAQHKLDFQIEEAKKASKGKELPGFAGVRFGDPAQGETLYYTSIPDAAGNTNGGGYGCVVLGPKLAKPFRSFVKNPLLYVTPKSRKVYRIEFSLDLKKTPSTMPDAETTNVVALLEKKFRRDALHLDPALYPLGRREYVFPFGETTLTVGEYGGDWLKLIVEHDGVRAEAKGETETAHKEALGEKVRVKILGSDKYPTQGEVKIGRGKLKKGTIRSFCGLRFGNSAPYDAKFVSTPQGGRAFFIDYRKAKLTPFMGFDHGTAEVGRANGAIMAVELYSDGSDEGLTDEEYFGKVRQALEDFYSVKPQTSTGDGPCPKLVYALGDVALTLAPDPRGGFMLRAENTVFKALW